MSAGNSLILADGRWAGEHGIGRFTAEVFPRLKSISVQTEGPKPLSFANLFFQPYYLLKNRSKVKAYFTPGFNALLYSPIPFIFIIHDLNHLHFPDSGKWSKKIYYHTLIKWTAKRAHTILTASEFSRKTISEWLSLPEEKIIVAGNGVSTQFKPEGEHYQPGFPYLLHVGNTKIHKNCIRLVKAFSRANIDREIKLILTGDVTKELQEEIAEQNLTERIIFSGTLSEEQLAQYYRGAIALLFPSLYEGFGLPVVESMASGTPVLTSNVTSLPEISGDAAVLIDPFDVDSLATGIMNLVTDQTLRRNLRERGLERAKLYSWDKTASIVQKVLNDALETTQD